MKKDRVKINRDYFIIAPIPKPGIGYYHALSERAYLVDNIRNFLENHQDIAPNQITIYELREVNEKQ